MKKILSILSMLLIVLLFVACGSKKGDVKKETNVAANAQKFIVGFDAEYPPFGSLAEDGKTYVGFDLDLAQEVCKRTGMEYVPQPIDWDSKDMELNSGSISCIWSGFTINGREDAYTWSVPYVDNSIVLVVKSDSGIKTKADLAGKIVMVQAASSGLAALEDEANKSFTSSFKKLEQCADYNSAFMNLEAGVVDCVAVDVGVAKYQINQKSKIFTMLAEPVSSEQYGIGFKKGDVELCNKVQTALFDMWNDGTFMNIAQKYSDYSIADTVCIGDYVK